jgi:serine/threonine protein kinase
MKFERWQKIKQLSEAALKYSPDERAGFLDDKCTDDELRRDVESFLSTKDTANSAEPNTVALKDEKLALGENLHHYKIIKRLGAGGMGEVYLAEDEKLHRLVVVKILTVEPDANNQYVRRFVLEARAASALNHPNIITIYEIGETGGTDFIAMEFVEGDSVRRLIDGRKLDLNVALEIAIQTASALAAAHGAGIIHRDIKPENIMRRPDGLVKVLDFGIAKHINARSDPHDVDTEATTQTKITVPGLVIGTVAYMSPEQARGKTCDARTDIWSLGIVLYEMITGEVPFGGETNSDTLAAILKTDPKPLSVHVSGVPRQLERIVKKTLGKDCEERYQVIKDLVLDLKILQRELDPQRISSEISIAPNKNLETQVQSAHTTESFLQKRRWTWLLVPALIVVAFLSGWFLWRQTRAPKINYSASLSSTQITSWKSELSELDASRARFSPKGSLLAYTASKNNSNAIWLKQIGGGEAFTRRQDDAKEKSPLFSPDGEQIAYISERGGRRGIWLAPSFGGAPILIATLESFSKGLVHWAKDGTKIYFEMRQNLYALDIASKQVTKLTSFDEARAMERGFSFSPDEKRMVYADRIDGQKDLWIADIIGENPQRLTNDEAEDSDPIWYKDGERVIYNSNRNGIKQICLAFLDGEPPVQLTFSDGDSNVSDISADGSKILYTTTKDDSDLWSASIADGKETQITSDIGVEFWQSIAPDGETIAYQAARRSSLGQDKWSHCLLLSQKIGGDQRQVQLAEDGFNVHWSPDGSALAFLRSQAGNNSLWIMSATGGDARAVSGGGVVFGGYLMLPFSRLQTQDYQWSPDSRSLIYCASRSGISNVWQATTDGAGEKQLTSNEDKTALFFNPLFSPDGSEIAWSVMNVGDPNRRSWSLWILTDGQARQIYQSESALRIVGWSPSGRELIVKSVEKSAELALVPGGVSLMQVALNGGPARPIAKLETTYFQNIALSPDRKTFAFVTRKSGSDTIQILPSTGGTARTLISSNDARVYFSSLAFAPDGKTLYYGKQANWQIISMINNFK